ncbi:hypothetical protein DXG03_003643 [Asterophora parasitica]|uniref:Uncharacterized protein n=1 Tax=Asterophora parasitica TaxID=117018 RepID=A0A9P7G319_9AGAR|nr:hypothetical protein DXG03_003643 [Asterophora parasitica]
MLSQGSYKGKGKARSAPYSTEHDERMWTDIYEPTTEAELAVHKRKVEDVRRWLQEAFEGGPSGALKKYRVRDWVSPSGTAKTTTIRVLARDMGFEIMEWRNAVSEGFDTNRSFTDGADASRAWNFDPATEAPFSKFEAFLHRASSCQNLFTSRAGSSSKSQPARHIILLEDLPNILHPGTQAQFHAAIQGLVASSVSNPPVPIVIVISDAGVRGEAGDDRMGARAKASEGVVDVRTALPRDLLGGPYVTQIGFNPIAPTLLTKALQGLLTTHFGGSSQQPPSREMLDAVVESANGDIRSAIMALQFACVVQMVQQGKNKKGSNKGKGKSAVLEAVTRREQSLVLFHLLGKVLYNKRKSDPPSSSATAKDIQKEKAIDVKLKDPPKLPPWFSEHERRTSRVDVDMLYADSPIDSSLFSLYVHQNYPQFTDGVEECEGVADWLSWVDSSGGDAWYQANPHCFHLLALGTLHSLPSPIMRRNQKILKPSFFECLQKEKTAWEGVRDTRGWALGDSIKQGQRRTGWSHADVILELGGVLRARDAVRVTASLPRPPTSHRSFSSLRFVFGTQFGDGLVLDEKEVNPPVEHEEEEEILAARKDVETEGGWLDSDAIEEF